MKRMGPNDRRRRGGRRHRLWGKGWGLAAVIWAAAQGPNAWALVPKNGRDNQLRRAQNRRLNPKNADLALKRFREASGTPPLRRREATVLKALYPIIGARLFETARGKARKITVDKDTNGHRILHLAGSDADSTPLILHFDAAGTGVHETLSTQHNTLHVAQDAALDTLAFQHAVMRWLVPSDLHPQGGAAWPRPNG